MDVEPGPFEFPGIYPVTGLRIPASRASTTTRPAMTAPEDRIFLTSIIDLLRSKGYTVIEPTTDSI